MRTRSKVESAADDFLLATLVFSVESPLVLVTMDLDLCPEVDDEPGPAIWYLRGRARGGNYASQLGIRNLKL